MPDFFPVVTKFGFYGQIFVEVCNIKFHENPSSGSRADVCGQIDRQTDRPNGGEGRFQRVSERAL
jgi:hypothetical protein